MPFPPSEPVLRLRVVLFPQEGLDGELQSSGCVSRSPPSGPSPGSHRRRFRRCSGSPTRLRSRRRQTALMSVFAGASQRGLTSAATRRPRDGYASVAAVVRWRWCLRSPERVSADSCPRPGVWTFFCWTRNGHWGKSWAQWNRSASRAARSRAMIWRGCRL